MQTGCLINMKVLVLGGTRYFGKRLVDLLLSEGNEVTVASTGKTKVSYVKSVEHLVIERKSASSLHNTLGNRNWDVVYDQICFTADEAKIACETFTGKIGRLVFTSSQSVYDYGVDIAESTFNALTYAGNPNNENPYQEGKRLAEQVFAKQNAFPVTATRFPVVMGPDDHTRRLHWHIARIKYGHPIFFPNPAGSLTVISSKDAAEFLRWVASKELNGPVNACSPDPVRLPDLVKIIEQATGKTFLQTSTNTKEDESSYGVEKDWCASSRKASMMGFSFSKAGDWLPSLVQQEKDKALFEDAKIHKVGF